ncbi:hypothetical protein MRX96_013787 [Rhipicephalus microplus]
MKLELLLRTLQLGLCIGVACCGADTSGGILPLNGRWRERVPHRYVARPGRFLLQSTELGRIQEFPRTVDPRRGGQFLRAVAQRCPEPPMRNLVSLGGQHQGVYGLPKCPGESSELCEYARKLLNLGAYWNVVQDHLVPAQYWQDPFDRKTYIAKSLFLADVNNERVKNESYKDNLLKLKNLVLVMFENDTVVDPKATSWFGYYAEHDDKTIVPLQNQKIYTEDWIGLKELDQSGRLHLLSTLGDHLQFKEEWFTENIIKQYLL